MFASSCSSRRRGVVVASSSRRHGIVNTVSMGETAKPQSLLVFWRLRKTSVSSRVSASPLASPCLWGKLQNIVRFAALASRCLWGKLQNLSLCLSSGVSVPMGEAARHRSFCCAQSCRVYGEAAKHQSLLVFWRLASPCLWGKLQNIVRFAALSEGMWKSISCLFLDTSIFVSNDD